MIGSRTIVGIGEALWDIFPDGPRLGGAPLNVAVMARQLGNAGALVSRIGQDQLGDTLRDELTQRQIGIDHLQYDPDHPTGTVYVELTTGGTPDYQVTDDVAWDYLQWDGDLAYLADRCHAVCFGTLAQRYAQTRNAIYRFLGEAHRAVRLYDLNLRSGIEDRRSLIHSLELAGAVKLNHDELTVLQRALVLGDDESAAIAKLIKTYDLDWIALTRGAEGTIVHTADGAHEGDPAATDPVAGANPVGAGDATSAALLHGVIRRWDWPRTITLANAVGAHVAGQPGACPDLTDAIKQMA